MVGVHPESILQFRLSQLGAETSCSGAALCELTELAHSLLDVSCGRHRHNARHCAAGTLVLLLRLNATCAEGLQLQEEHQNLSRRQTRG